MQDPLTLGQVCAAWSDIAVSSPELWSHIKITYPRLELNNSSARNFRSLLKTILPLSGQLPLDIQFRLDEHTSSGDAMGAFTLLLGEHHRASLKLPLDLLEQLRATGGKLSWDVSDDFVDTPSLRKVELHESIGLESFAFPQITHLAASFTAIHNLHTHSLLEKLHLKERDVDDIAFPHRIALPKVRRPSKTSHSTIVYGILGEALIVLVQRQRRRPLATLSTPPAFPHFITHWESIV
ncbi:hypothetical protein DFS33DRAFT_1487787 [Desarmillaria ectypa]|nr:hypothetical protein DFS33DRAFT_1487787 [Desarmillaria ectypa]